ncbi:hypothetical protein GCM10009716_04730 [Streptomyces sodiiphilus]|uniref:Bacterial sugar transferase domain-containing protein n=1 Tax=Streptomyces sodiiphilus TaxID=226217 RepID=A0ABN2NRI5_9ACTN
MRHSSIPQTAAEPRDATPAPLPADGPAREKAAWYAPAAAAADTLGVLVPVLVVFHTAGESRPVLAAAVATVAWLGVRVAHGRYRPRAVGESRGLLAAVHDWLILAGLLAVLRVVTGESSALPTAVAALAPSLAVTGLATALIHAHLRGLRRQARAVRRVLVVGQAGPADAVTGQLAARTDHAYVVVGAVRAGEAPLTCGVPELGRLPAEDPGTVTGPDGSVVLRAARAQQAGLVLVTPGTLLTGERLRRLSWVVQDAGLPLAVASGLTEVARGRVRVSTPAGLNLLHLTPPVRSGPRLMVKYGLDRTGAAVGLVLLSPLLLALALAVRLDSPGPVLYRQTRIGHRGKPFTMWKFRSMVTGADRLRSSLEDANEQSGPRFKMRRDPRITRLGRFLRSSSLDELPQLVNVARGEMSLVGPRPPLPEEVAAYDGVELRRLCVRPGITGLWQVSGRSELSWDESLALDLSYTDNWSVAGDLDVLARTLRAVAGGRGAY